MVKTYYKSVGRDILGSFARFIAIICIVALGVGFLIGALSTTPILQESVDAYYDETNTMDINVKSQYGLSDNEIEKIEKIDGVVDVYGSYQIDGIARYNGESVVSRFSSIDEVNEITLIEGQMPSKNEECVVKKGNGELKNFNINDEITYNEKTYKIVGIVDSPLYYYAESEKTQTSMANIDAFFFLDKENIDYGVYTDIYVVVNAKEMNCFSSEYREYVSSISKKIEEINEDYYVLTRNENFSYAMYDISSRKVEDVAKVFPIFFFLVALLVTLATMTRMIEEERMQIGTLKALGYGKFTIAKKYLLYSGIASIIGSIIGVIWGFIVLPLVLYNTYQGLFILPDIKLRVIPSYSIISCIVTIASTLLATIYASFRALAERPAALMTVRAPKPGKRILLERVRIIWNRLSFSYKSTARNLFRYKKHFFMTVFGVAGCTALVLTGFGLRDSVRSISEVQYDEIFKYDIKINSLGSVDEELNEFLSDKESVSLEYLSTTAHYDDEVDIMVYNVNKDISNYISINTRKGNEKIEITENSVILCETASVMIGAKKGDEIEVDGKKLVITDVSENYTNNYLYLGEKVYEENFTSSTYMTFVNYDMANENILEEIYECDCVVDAELKSYERKTYGNIISSMEVFTVVLILAAGALGMIVIYNLINIIIRERKKELATLRVLGYHTREVFIYIFREVLILSIIGAAVGLFLGILLHRYVIYTSESMDVIFGRDIFWQSYVYSFVITIVFTIIVGLCMVREIKKIEMAESMKAVE